MFTESVNMTWRNATKGEHKRHGEHK